MVLTDLFASVILNMLDKGSRNIGATVESKSGERWPLSSNKADVRSPDLVFNPNSEFVSEDVAIDYLASILVEIVLHIQNVEHKQKGGDLLPGIYKGASR